MYQETTRGIPAVASEQGGEWSRRRASEQARKAARASHTSGRRRMVDPTTSDRDYSADELEFIKAMHEYKHRSGRMFPTWSEVLEVLVSLGYEKPQADAPDPTPGHPDASRSLA